MGIGATCVPSNRYMTSLSAGCLPDLALARDPSTRCRPSACGPPQPGRRRFVACIPKTPQVGEQAPDFELPGTEGPFKLSEHRGERVVLLFYPGDNTMVCTKQFCSYRDRAGDFAALEATVVGISSQDLDSHKGFVEKHGLTVPLLADVDKSVAKAYSAFSPRLGTKRAVIVIDEQGVVRHRHDHLLGLDYQSVDDLKAVLDTLPSASAA
jgi:peroxiredoxin Q/BCP